MPHVHSYRDYSDLFSGRGEHHSLEIQLIFTVITNPIIIAAYVKRAPLSELFLNYGIFYGQCASSPCEISAHCKSANVIITVAILQFLSE